MDHFIDHLEIENFKSIRQLKLDCKRVNVFIGKPNVGKSNILEAVGLLNPLLLLEKTNIGKAIRFENPRELHYDNDENNTIKVSINKEGGFALRLKSEYSKKDDFFEENASFIFLNKFLIEEIDPIILQGGEEIVKNNAPLFSINLLKISNQDKFKLLVNDEFKIKLRDGLLIKKYDFIKNTENIDGIDNSLSIPFGSNLFDVVSKSEYLKKKIVDIYQHEYGLQFVFSKLDKKLLVQKYQDGYVYQYPYSSVADTFQRFVFYLAAIQSNTNSVLVFEEPEVHSFPPYIKELAEEIVAKDDNQYFISTHSPYMLQTLVEELGDDELNVVLTYYRDYQTYVKVLTPEELRDVQNYNIDVFFNLAKFEPNA